MTTDIEPLTRPVVFHAGELAPVPVRRRPHVLGKVAVILVAGVTAIGALTAVASWSVTGSVGTSDPPTSLWYVPPSAVHGATDLSVNQPLLTGTSSAESTAPVSATQDDAVVPTAAEPGDDRTSGAGTQNDDHGSGADDVSGSADRGGSGGGSGTSGSGTSGSGGSGSDDSGSGGGADDASSLSDDGTPDQGSGRADANNSGSGRSGLDDAEAPTAVVAQAEVQDAPKVGADPASGGSGSGKTSSDTGGSGSGSGRSSSGGGSGSGGGGGKDDLGG